MSRRMLFAFLLCMLLLPAMTMAQAAGGAGGAAAGAAGGRGGGRGGRGAGGAGGGRGNFDPAAFRQQQLDNIKVLLEATDDEWKVLSPKVEKLLTAQAANPRGGRGGGGAAGGRGGRGRGGAGGAAPAPAAADPNNPVAVALQDLRTALETKDTPAPTLAGKLKALRDARVKAATDLASSQKDLKEVLTQRQEAIMVSNGYLE